MLTKILILVLIVSVSVVQSTTINRSKRQFSQYGQQLPRQDAIPVPVPAPVPAPVPTPLPVPAPIVPPIEYLRIAAVYSADYLWIEYFQRCPQPVSLDGQFFSHHSK